MALDNDELLISPLMSLVVLALLLVVMSWGTSFFAKMQEVPMHAWEVLNVFRGDLFDTEARKALLGVGGLGGLRSLVGMTADPDPATQSKAASAFVSLLELAARGMEELPDAQLEAVVHLAGKYTPRTRAHAAVAIGNAALSSSTREKLVACGGLKAVLELSAVDDAEVQAAAALALALLSQSEAARAAMLKEGGLPALFSLLRASHPTAVRCASFALVSLAQADAGRVVRAFPPKVLVMITRSKDFVLQSIGAQLVCAIATEPTLRVPLLRARAVPPLLTLALSSFSAAARFDATLALWLLGQRNDALVKTAERDQAAELLLAEMTGWASGLLRVKQLRALNAALGARALATTLEYYEGQPNLAKYTVDQELSRMRYAVRTPSGEQLRGADDVRKYHESLAEDEQTSMLWRLANQSLLSDLMIALMEHGYANEELGASVRATACHFLLDFQKKELRVVVYLGVFVAAPVKDDDGGGEAPMQLVALVCYLVVKLPTAKGETASAAAAPAAPAAAAAPDSAFAGAARQLCAGGRALVMASWNRAEGDAAA